MNAKNLLIGLLLLMITAVLSAQKNYEFLGKVNINGANAKDVLIKAFDGDTCFSNHKTSTNGKFIFSGEAEKYFILQFEKPGYVTKQLIVNTSNIRHLENKIKKYKFDINLQRLKKGASNDKYLYKVDIIEIDNSGKGFTYKSRRDRKEYLRKDEQMASRF